MDGASSLPEPPSRSLQTRRNRREKIFATVRVRALRMAILILARALTACSRGLLTPSATDAILALDGDAGFGKYENIVVERLLVLQILDRDEPRSHRELEAALSTVEPLMIQEALRTLDEKDIILRFRGQVYASQCLLRLDELGLIAI
jgi:hypothetical protein